MLSCVCGNQKINTFEKKILMSTVITREILDKATELRKLLHQHPELSGREKQTAARIREWLEQQNPDRIIEGLGGHGLAAVFDSGKPGPDLLFRADLDALPIDEINTFDYKSENPGVSHKCGHDAIWPSLVALP